MRRARRCGRNCLLFSVIFLALFAFQALALEYIIGTDDVLQISFWQQSDLNTIARVRQDGKISLPVLGDVQAAGLTLEQLEMEVVRGISIYNKEISQAMVDVLEYNSRRVFVTGEVYRPGKYSFEQIPNLWEVIREAGGPRERAMLSDITVIHAAADGGQKISINLAQALDEGDFSKLPQLKPGDTVMVPSLPGESAMGGADLLGRSVVFIYGQIARPGVYPIEDGSTLLQALTQAGGTTPEADLKNVRVLMKQGTSSTVATVDVEEHIRKGNPPDFPLHAGDTVVISKKSGIWRGLWSGMTGVAAFTSGVVSLVYLIDWLAN